MFLLFFSSASHLLEKNNQLLKYACNLDFTASKEEGQSGVCIAKEKGSMLKKT